MSDQVTIKIVSDSAAANTDLNKTAANLRSVGAAGMQANTGAAAAATGFKGMITSLRGLTSLFGMAGIIGGLFSLIAVVNRLYAVWQKAFPKTEDPFANFVASADVAKKAVKDLTDQYDRLAAARDKAARAGISRATASVDRTAAGLAADEANELDPVRRADLAEQNAAFLERRRTEAALAAARVAAGNTNQNVADNRTQRADLEDRLGRVKDRAVWGESAPARAKATAAIPVLEAAIKALDDSLPLLASAAAAAADTVDAAQTRHDTALTNIKSLNTRRSEEAREKAKEASLAAAEKVWNVDEARRKDKEARAKKRADAAADEEALNKQTAAKTAAITVDAPRAASAAASIGGVTGGMMNNTARMADQRAAAMEAIQNEHTRLLSEIKTRLEE